MATQTWTIGSDHTCDLVVENRTVSSKHCRLSVDGSKMTLTDLHSTNGTYINGVRLEGTRVINRVDRITLGKTQPMPWPEALQPPGSDPKLNDFKLQRADRQVITIGRSPDNTLVLNETNVSLVHARITISGDEIVLEDLGSTNGTSVGTVKNKIQRAVVSPDDTIFFGSLKYHLSDLLPKTSLATEQADNRPATIPVSGQTSSKTEMVRSPMVMGLAGAGVLALVLVVASIIWWPGEDSKVASNTESEIASADLVTSVSESDENSDDDRVEVEESGEGSVAVVEDETLTAEERLKQGLYLVVCADPQRETPFRIGTAFAVDGKHLATSASVIYTIRELKENGFPQVMIVQPASGDELNMVSARAHPEYVIAKRNFNAARERYDEIMDEVEMQTPDPESFEEVKQTLLSAQLKAMEFLERMTTYDVGIMEVDRSLKHWLPGIDTATSLRPKLKLNLTGYAIDKEDPYFDSAVPIDVTKMSSRIQTLSTFSSDVPERLLASGTADQNEYSFLGSPALNAQGKVVAIYSRPTPPRVESDPPEPTGTFDAPLFERVRECLAVQP